MAIGEARYEGLLDDAEGDLKTAAQNAENQASQAAQQAAAAAQAKAQAAAAQAQAAAQKAANSAIGGGSDSGNVPAPSSGSSFPWVGVGIGALVLGGVVAWWKLRR